VADEEVAIGLDHGYECAPHLQHPYRQPRETVETVAREAEKTEAPQHIEPFVAAAEG
jgi:hypothetical protein